MWFSTPGDIIAPFRPGFNFSPLRGGIGISEYQDSSIASFFPHRTPATQSAALNSIYRPAAERNKYKMHPVLPLPVHFPHYPIPPETAQPAIEKAHRNSVRITVDLWHSLYISARLSYVSPTAIRSCRQAGIVPCHKFEKGRFHRGGAAGRGGKRFSHRGYPIAALGGFMMIVFQPPQCYRSNSRSAPCRG